MRGHFVRGPRRARAGRARSRWRHPRETGACPDRADERDRPALQRVGLNRGDHDTQRGLVQRVGRAGVVGLVREVGELDETGGIAQRRAANHRPDLNRDRRRGWSPARCTRITPTRDRSIDRGHDTCALDETRPCRRCAGCGTISDTSVAVCVASRTSRGHADADERAGVERRLSRLSSGRTVQGRRIAITATGTAIQSSASRSARRGAVTCATLPERSRPSGGLALLRASAPPRS